MNIDHLLEYLIPIIFLLVWGIGRVFRSKPTEGGDVVLEEEAREESFDNEFEEIFEREVLEQKEAVRVPREGVVRAGETVLFSPFGDFVVQQNQGGIKIKEGIEPVMRVKKRDEIVKLLKEPYGMRKIVVGCEVLGKPLCLRRREKRGRGWPR